MAIPSILVGVLEPLATGSLCGSILPERLPWPNGRSVLGLWLLHNDTMHCALCTIHRSPARARTAVLCADLPVGPVVVIAEAVTSQDLSCNAKAEGEG